ncbi:hypothetical protein JOD43_001712 [Pullulanibacillus pueri]|uniref:Alkaliphily related protein n=1 Tax=Pullulanibacillus pueri TaxID=1437324 RepID=A0A8J2ZUQ5_9BACL|nr:DUF2759 family protein [Pullulanibacillus pueri]MBM7681545.1 hypothetical protein [Pullulanibacillus pueri]GGH79730.1 hypothetical protein GCM10007096_15090 [Pullulanibacillus pueri]
MVVGIIFLLIALLCLLAIIREAKRRNFFGAGYAFICCIVLGWFALYTIIDIMHGGGVSVAG